MSSNKQITPTRRALSCKEAATYISMGTSWLAHGRVEGSRLNRTPHPPFIKIGRSIKYLVEDLDTWLDSFRKLDNLAQLSVTSMYTDEWISRNQKSDPKVF